MIQRLTSIATLTLLLGACESSAPAPSPAVSPRAEPQASPTPPREATNLVAKVPEPPVDLATVPVEEDFEQEAETQVSAANLAATLDQLEKEISAE